MRSPSPQPAYGSSKASGGTFRGRKETTQLADMENDAEDEARPWATGLVRVYITPTNPSEIDPADRASNHAEECDTVPTLAPILKKLQRKLPSISSKSSLVHFMIEMLIYSGRNHNKWVSCPSLPMARI